MRGSLVRVQQDPVFQKFFRRPYQLLLVDHFAKGLGRIHPLWVTAFSCLFGLLAALTIFSPLFSISLLLLSGYLDTLDGTIARLHGKTSPLGAVSDIVSDRIVEVAIILALFFIDPTRALETLLMLASCLLCITSFLVVRLYTEELSGGLIERAEAFLFFTLMILFPSFFPLLAWIFSSLVLFTAGKRFYDFAFIQLKT
ncbi:MAG: hypothetical protein S4CHLAM45_11870 [Chlamydiales bacterium]|nr:hypothetical protein [Chlamydiales bacterium]MCH9619679.1 hypothetical protein [Chlamydiales bacterium]MCH9623285.1 hypothetical protein [Chlamydiales bacterium]